MTIKPLLLAVAVGILFWVMPISLGYANTDQHCLQMCINSGAGGEACLQQCTFTKPKPMDANHEATLNEAHNVLNAPKPVGGEVLLPENAPKKIAQEKDYVCFNQCLKSGGQYNFCNQRCVKTNCPMSTNQFGANQCKDLTGKAPWPTLLTSPSVLPSRQNAPSNNTLSLQ